MPNTPNLGLPLLAAAQAQKHVTHNEALVGLDTLVQLAVVSKGLTAPPASPAEGDRYLIAGANPTGAWSSWSGRIARFQDGQWISYRPKPGWFAYVADENDLYTYTGSAWASFRAVVYAVTTLQNLSLLGIGTTADATNPFAAKLNKTLWTAKTAAEGGTGDLRYTLNKEGPARTLSLLLQSAFSGRAEIGLTGDDDLHLKVSGDGASWTEAVRIDRATGGVGFLAASTDLASAATADLGAVNSLKVDITGTTAITSFGTRPNAIKLVRFAGALALTHNATSLVLPGAANIATAAGDTAIATSDSAGNWRVRHYQRADGQGVAQSVRYDVSQALTAAQMGQAQANAGLRQRLAVNRTYYVRNDGSDSNTGLSDTAAGAFLTLQKAWDTVASLDVGAFTATIQLGDGTRTAGLNMQAVPLGTAPVVIQGNAATPANVLLSVSGDGFMASGPAQVIIKGMKLACTGACIYANHPGANVQFDNIDFGASAVHLRGDYGRLFALGNYAVSGGANQHILVVGLATVIISLKTVTITGTPNFADAFVNAQSGGQVVLYSATLSGAATGKRYTATLNAVINTFGAGTANTYFPGNVAGTTATGGQQA